MQLRGLVKAVALALAWLATLISYYWAVEGGGGLAAAAFMAALVLAILLTVTPRA